MLYSIHPLKLLYYGIINLMKRSYCEILNLQKIAENLQKSGAIVGKVSAVSCKS